MDVGQYDISKLKGKKILNTSYYAQIDSILTWGNKFMDNRNFLLYVAEALMGIPFPSNFGCM